MLIRINLNLQNGRKNLFKYKPVITFLKDGMELIFARQRIVTVAKAFGLQAIDMVHIDFKDLEGLRSHSEYSAKMGFTGKQVIHPNQIEIVHDSYRYLLENYRFYHFLKYISNFTYTMSFIKLF